MQTKKKETFMKKIEKFPFDRARKIAKEEVQRYRHAYKNTFAEEPPPRLGRPPKASHHKYCDIHLKLHPKALKWARVEAKRRGIGYQTLINEILLDKAA